MHDELIKPSELLGTEGPFIQNISDFSVRLQQQQMGDAVFEAILNYDKLVVEAGTGVGKTFAYLIPALLEGGKVIISTGTRHLQDQLFHRDIPIVLRNLDIKVDSALLKGRANYLCIQRLQDAEIGVDDGGLIDALQTVRVWSRMTKTGDIVELDTIPEESEVWSKITSTVDNCLGSGCPKFNDCYVVKARRRAQEADIVVVNHHLFFADMALKEDGFGEVLPTANTFILDEAHQLADTATRFFGQAVSSRQIQDLVKDITKGQLQEASDMAILREQAQLLIDESRKFRLAIGDYDRRTSWQVVSQDQSVQDRLQSMNQVFDNLLDSLGVAAERGEILESCFKRCELLIHKLKQFTQQSDEYVSWFETYRASFILHLTPLDIAAIFQKYMMNYNASWIFTSATLSVNNTFDHFLTRMGLMDSKTKQLDSPYDYPNHTLLYLPQDMPEPNSANYTERVIEAVLPILKLSRGRAFLLFTSYRALHYASSALSSLIDFPIFTQGDAPKSKLLDQFRESDNGVLLGTSSFWEGVDIKGQSLSCVIIDKLPFAAPGDPVMQARLDMIKAQNGNPFMEYQIPQAVITLKQGIGRLVRDEKDKGLLVICDPRIKTKFYGRLFINSLPEIPVTDNFNQVEHFFELLEVDP